MPHCLCTCINALTAPLRRPGLATQLAAAATRADGTPLGIALDDALVLDCSLAVSDEERRRCLLAYDRTSRELTAAPFGPQGYFLCRG